MKFKWPLNTSNFTWLDRFKLCKFFLNPNNRWTMDEKVKEFETKMAKFMGYKYAIFCSSGSTANTILAMYLRDKTSEFSDRNLVILPSTTWQTSCSPFIREGFKPYFIDISMNGFGMDLDKLEKFLKKNHFKVSAIFPTSLLGFNIDYTRLKNIQKKYPDIRVFIDNCENNFADFESGRHDASYFTSTTSTYFGHELQSVEGGFIFTNNCEEYAKFLMYRNHGMARSLDSNHFINLTQAKQLYTNNKVDSRFDFYSLGNNFRNSEIHALIGLLDFKRVYKYIKERRDLYDLYYRKLNRGLYILPNSFSRQMVPFCIPIILKSSKGSSKLSKIKEYCFLNEIEYRPIISGFLGYQTAYKNLVNKDKFTNSKHLHNNGIYIGLHSGVKDSDIIKLVSFLNSI